VTAAYKKLSSRGFTLAELIVAMGVMSVVMICAAVLVGFIARGYTTANELADSRNAVNGLAASLTKEIRKYSYSDIKVNADGSFKINGAAYTRDADKVKRDGEVVAKGIALLTLTKNDEDKSISLTITSTSSVADAVTHSSIIYMRE